MKKYNLLKESDIISNNHYLAIVYYPYPSPNRNAMTEFVYCNQDKDFCGTSKDIRVIVDESIISVLFEYNPERVCSKGVANCDLVIDLDGNKTYYIAPEIVPHVYPNGEEYIEIEI